MPLIDGGAPVQPAVRAADEDQEYFFEEGCYILEYSNGAHDPELSIARARVPPGVATRLHALRGTTERYLVLAGEGVARVGDGEHPVGPGAVVFIPPDCPQRIRNTGEHDLVFLALCTPRFEAGRYRDLEAPGPEPADPPASPRSRRRST